MTCGSTNLTDEKTSKTSKRRADSSNNSTPHPTVALDLISKRAKIEVTLAASEAGQMTQIESEFQILKSLIPNIANKQQINEVRIIYEFKIIVEGRNRKISFRLKSKYFLLLQHFFGIWNISNLEMFTCLKYIQKYILKSSEIYLFSSWKSLMHVSVILKLCNHNWNWLNQYRIITN